MSLGHRRYSQNLAQGGRLLAIQACDDNPGTEIIQKLWLKEDPFQIDRQQLIAVSAIRVLLLWPE
jgi:hypothetical protein